MKMFKVFSVGVMLVAVGCGGAPPEPAGGPAKAPQSEAVPIPFPPGIGNWTAYTTVPGHPKAEVSDLYSCGGWSYRMFFSWNQYRDASSPTGSYADIGLSTPDTVGSNHQDVSADVYLTCYGGILIQDYGQQPGGNPIYGMFYGSNWDQGNWISCQLHTVWPASWHAQDPITTVYLRAYYYTPAPVGAYADPTDPYGKINFYLSSGKAGGTPGSGWCGDGWVRTTVLPLDKVFETSATPASCQDAVNVGLINSMSCGCPNGNLNAPKCDYYPPPCDSVPIDGCMNFPPKSGGV